MKCFVLFLCLLFPVCQAHELYSQMFIIPKYTLPQRSGYSTLNYYDPYQAGSFTKATLFCTDDRKVGGSCDHFENKLTETKLRDATVSVVRRKNGQSLGSCVGTVIRLKKEGRFCKKPLLLTSAHCVNVSGVTGEKLGAYNHIGGAFISPNEIKELQGLCLDTSKKTALSLQSL